MYIKKSGEEAWPSRSGGKARGSDGSMVGASLELTGEKPHRTPSSTTCLGIDFTRSMRSGLSSPWPDLDRYGLRGLEFVAIDGGHLNHNWSASLSGHLLLLCLNPVDCQLQVNLAVPHARTHPCRRHPLLPPFCLSP